MRRRGAEVVSCSTTPISEVDRIFVEMHDHITGLSGVARLFATLCMQGFVYDPRHSVGRSVVLFQRLGATGISSGPIPADR